MFPRSFSTILVALLTLGVVFLWQFSTSPSFYRDVFGRSNALKEWLEEEEERYVEVVQDRHQLISKWGPTDVEVEAYPTNGQHYTLWDFFIPAFQCPHRVERVGTLGDGGKWVCGLDRVAKQDECVVYSFGINGESSFEQAVLQRAPNCEVWGYDYSVDGWGPEITDDPELAHRAHFEPWALSGTDRHRDQDDRKYWTLDSLMKHNGHAFIDILKIDIEGSEFDALKSFITSYDDGDLPIGQLQLEVHAWYGRERFDYFVRWWESLEAAGLRPFWAEPNLVYLNINRGVGPTIAEYAFMNIGGDHALVNEAFN